MALPFTPAIWAYSGVSQPIRTYNQTATENIAGVTSGNKTLTIDVYEDGVIQGFLGSLNINTLNNYAPNTNYITVSILRNGQTLFSQSVNFLDFPYYRGLAVYETLNMLSGAEVRAGEQFKINVFYSNNANSDINFTYNIMLTIKSISRSFSV